MKMRIVWADKARTFLLKIQKSYSPQDINNSSKKKMQENALLNMQSLYLRSKFSFFIDESTNF